MSIACIFVCYAEKDVSFATRLIADLREAGASVATDSIDPDDPYFEHFLNEILPHSQHLIVVQTPDVLQSTQVRSIVYAALKHVQQGQMDGVLRIVAPTTNTDEPLSVPRLWEALPEFNARQDYPRMLARLFWHLGLKEQNDAPQAPPPPTPPVSSPGTPQLAIALPPVLSQPIESYSEPTLADAQAGGLAQAGPSQPSVDKDRPLRPHKRARPSLPSAEKDRPLRPHKYRRSPVDPRLILASLILAVLLVVAGVILFVHQALASPLTKATPATTGPTVTVGHTVTTEPAQTTAPTTGPRVTPTSVPTSVLAPTPTSLPAIDAQSMTPAQLHQAVTSQPTSYASSLSQEDAEGWDLSTQSVKCLFTDGHYKVYEAQLSGFQVCHEYASTYTDFAFQVQMTIQSGTNADGGGLVFRESSAGAYRMHVGINGSFDVSGTGLSGSSSVIKTGAGQTNLLTVIMQGPKIFIYVNKQNLGTASNSTFANGTLGFMAVAFARATTVTFANVQIWTF